MLGEAAAIGADGGEAVFGAAIGGGLCTDAAAADLVLVVQILGVVVIGGIGRRPARTDPRLLFVKKPIRSKIKAPVTRHSISIRREKNIPSGLAIPYLD